HRLRLAIQSKSFKKIGGEAEIDETYIGGKARNMHPDKRRRVMAGAKGGHTGKVAVMGLLERHGTDGHSLIRTHVLDGTRRIELMRNVYRHVEQKATIYTDAFSGYEGASTNFVHKVIDHAEKYVDGEVHTNGIENFW